MRKLLGAVYVQGKLSAPGILCLAHVVPPQVQVCVRDVVGCGGGPQGEQLCHAC